MKEAFLLVSLFVVHFLGDYTHLSTAQMLSAKRLGTPLWPIFKHASVHAVLVMVVCAMFQSFFLWKAELMVLACVTELVTHFIVDVLKGRINVWYPAASNPTNKVHWYIFGADQLAHHIVLIFIFLLLRR